MKKFFTAALFVFILLALAACDWGGSVQDTTATQQETPSLPGTQNEIDAEIPAPVSEELNIQIALADETLLSTFSHIHEVNYADVHEVYFGTIESDVTLVIWANIPLQNFALLTFSPEPIGDETLFIPINTFGKIDTLKPNEAFAINSYIGMGTLPWSGITFVDESGLSRYFAMQQSQMDGRYHIFEFENRTHELPPEWTPWWKNSAD